MPITSARSSPGRTRIRSTTRRRAGCAPPRSGPDEPRLDEVHHRRRDLDVLDHLRADPRAVRLLGDELPLAQAADDLEGEERVAVGLVAICPASSSASRSERNESCEQREQVLRVRAAAGEARDVLRCAPGSRATPRTARGALVPISRTRWPGSASASEANSARPSSGAKCRSSIRTIVGARPQARASRSRTPSAASPWSAARRPSGVRLPRSSAAKAGIRIGVSGGTAPASPARSSSPKCSR